MIGKKLNHYEILEIIDAGGMGEVYRARDTKLGRDVAIKVLPAALARDPGRLERLDREAKAIAALNHPNIVTIYSVEESEGVRFLTMELIEGETLSRLIGKEGLPLGKFFDLGIALADALAAAHAHGITHRDIKPSNIMVGKDGRLRVLDFGLAKLRDLAMDSDLTESPTVAAGDPVTAEGVVVGTVTYMSPEQAEGKTLDERSDIFSLGVVLYEMATGMRPFRGDTPASLISSILRDDPPSISEVNRQLPRNLGRIVKRCLAKEVDRRFQTALDVRNELAELELEWESGELAELAPLAAGRSRRRRVRAWSIGGGVVAIAVLASIGLVWQRSRNALQAPSPPPRLKLTKFTDQIGFQGMPAISPDGKLVAFVGGPDDSTDIFLQRVGGERAIDLTPDFKGGDSEPAFSPDGNRIAFRSERDGGGIFVMGATGESPRRVTGKGYWPSWSPDGTELVYGLAATNDPRNFAGEGGMECVNLASGKTRSVLTGMVANPVWSPHGERIAYWVVRGGQRDIWTVRPDGSDPRSVTDDKATDWRPLWAADGRYLYFISDRGGADNIWRVAIDEASGRPHGVPEPITSGTSAVGFFDMTRDGHHIAFSQQTSDARLERVPFDFAKERIRGAPALIVSSSVAVPDVSPDGRWIAYMTFGLHDDICVVRMDGSGLRRLTNDAYRDRFPRWSPRGDLIAFFSNRSGSYEIWTIRPDGSDLRQRTDSKFDLLAPVWSPDGSKIVCSGQKYASYVVELSDSVATLERGTLRPLPPFTQEGESFQALSWSPDGRWIAGTANTPNGDQVALAALSLPTGQYVSFTKFAKPQYVVLPTWFPDGRRLGYGTSDGLFVFDVVDRVAREVPTPKPEPGEWRVYAFSSSGRTLLRLRGSYNVDVWLADVEAPGQHN